MVFVCEYVLNDNCENLKGVELMKDLKGKVALITGAATGIGRAASLILAEKGANIVINYYPGTEKKAEDTFSEVQKFGVKGMIYPADVSKDAEVREMFNKAMELFGRLDILVNNAGVTNFVDLHDLEGLREEYWDRAFNVNSKAIFFTSRACAEELKKNKGCIVNTTSTAGFNGRGSSMAYAASKAAGISITKSLALVLAPEVRVNSVAPGIVLTRWVEGKEDHVNRLSAGTPLGKPANAEDIAEVIVSLITSAALITGQTIVVDGGFNI